MDDEIPDFCGELGRERSDDVVELGALDGDAAGAELPLDRKTKMAATLD